MLRLCNWNKKYIHEWFKGFHSDWSRNSHRLCCSKRMDGNRAQGKCNDNSAQGGIKMKFLIIDNYDSFVYNIAQLLGELNVESDVIRNDKVTIDDIKKGNYDAIIISPIPGVCLGHQGIIHAFGGKVVNAGNVRHGKTSPVEHTTSPLFEGVQNPFKATRYHSLVGDKTIIPEELK